MQLLEESFVLSAPVGLLMAFLGVCWWGLPVFRSVGCPVFVVYVEGFWGNSGKV